MRFFLKPFLLLWKAILWLWRHKKISGGIIFLFILAFIFWPRPQHVVPTQKVSRTTLTQSVSVSGTITAKKSVNLSFAISGPLTWVGVKKGDTVTQYQTIATLDQRIAQKNLQAALISYSLQRNTFDQTQSDNQNRTPDQALTDAMKRILQDNQYNLDQAVNSVELQDLAKQQSVISTPFAGIITRADALYPGPDALAGTTIWTVTDPTSVVFDMDVDQADIGKITNGQKVQIVFDAYPNTTLSETVSNIDFVSHTTSNGGNAFTVETTLPANTTYMYRSGMNGNADIIYGEKFNILTIPLSAVVNNTYVYVKVAKGFTKKHVTLGTQNDTDTEVITGLSEGDMIALDPTLAMKEVVK